MRFRLLLLLLSLSTWAQNPYPQDYFRSPLDLPVHPSGTFGELRSNHFHAGLDYRTNQREGYPVYAAADGYVSRIKVSAYGYGTAIYIDHPNGFTTLYGHLSAYAGKIEEYVRAKQYEKKSFEIELFPKPGELPIKKSDVIAYTGNTGGSGGPHLHFEYRDTKTEMIINPLLFGLDMKDPKKPTIYSVMAYPLSEDAVINDSRKPFIVSLKQLPDGNFIAEKILAKGKIGFGINASDKSTGSSGNNGIYKAETFFNGAPMFGYTFDTFAFSESRAVNNFIDYARYHETGQRYQKLFTKTSFPLSVLKNNKGDGQFAIVSDTLKKNYRIEVSDFHGNKVTVNGTIEYSDAPATIADPKHITSYYVKSANDNNYTKNKVSVFIPANAFYEDFYMDFDVKDSILHLHNPTVPVNTYVTVSWDVSGMSKEDLQKTFIAGFTDKRLYYNDSYMQDGKLTAKIKVLGNLKLAKDVTNPKIYAPNFKEGEWLTKDKTFALKISDDMAGIATYDAWINGKWALMHYDYKTRVIYHNFSDGIVAEGRNDLKVTVTDNVGNSTTFETHFFRSQNTAAVENNK